MNDDVQYSELRGTYSVTQARRYETVVRQLRIYAGYPDLGNIMTVNQLADKGRHTSRLGYSERTRSSPVWDAKTHSNLILLTEKPSVGAPQSIYTLEHTGHTPVHKHLQCGARCSSCRNQWV